MKAIIFLGCFFCLFQVALAQEEAISAQEAGKYVGKTVWVICDIQGVREAKEAGKSHYLNVGGKFPNQILTISCTGDFKQKYGTDLASLQGKTVRVFGKIAMYKEKPEIRNPEKITLPTQTETAPKTEKTAQVAPKDTINAKEAREYVGKSIWVKCEVKGTREAREEGKPHYINVGAPYPNHVFTVVVIGDMREKYDLNLSSLKDKTVLVYGKIELFKDAPQIKNPSQMIVLK